LRLKVARLTLGRRSVWLMRLLRHVALLLICRLKRLVLWVWDPNNKILASS